MLRASVTRRSLVRSKDSIYAELEEQAKPIGSIKKAENLVGFGSWVLQRPQGIVPQGLGA